VQLKLNIDIIMKNKYVIVRAKHAGVFFGKYESHNESEITLNEVRKLHYWDGAAAVEEIAMIGTKKPDDCRFTVTIPSMVIAHPIQIIEAKEEAVKAIQSVSEWRA